MQNNLETYSLEMGQKILENDILPAANIYKTR